MFQRWGYNLAPVVDSHQNVGKREVPLADRLGHRVHVICLMAVVVLALASLLGWLLGAREFTTLSVGRPALSVMTACGLLDGAAAAAILPNQRTSAQIAGAAEALFGIAVVVAHGFDWASAPSGAVDWWSSPITGCLFAASGVSAVLLASNRVVPGQALAYALLMFAVLLGLGHAVPDADLYIALPGTGVAIPTVVAFACLALGQLAACRRTGIARALTSRNAAGRTGLWLMSVSFIAILAISLALLVGRRRHVFDADTAVLLMAWGALLCLGLSLWGVAIAVDRANSAKANAERERDELRRTVAAAISHDLRNPLHTATLATAILKRLPQGAKAPAPIQQLERSHRRIDRLLSAILDSLAFDGRQAVTVRATVFELRDLVQEIVEDHASKLGGRVSVDGNAQVHWDRDAMYRAIENLLLNADKYGAPGRPIHCAIQADNHDVRLDVTNESSLIPEAEWQSIFEPFARGKGAHVASKDGWGVGLAFSRLVATAHGGVIRVKSSDQATTVFELSAPRSASAHQTRELGQLN